MAEVTVDIVGRSYRVACEDGEENHLLALAEYIGAEAQQLTRQMGQLPEGRLMLMTALMVADRLTETEARIAGLERKASEAKDLAESRAAPTDMFSEEREEELAGRVNQLAARIEGMAARLANGAGA